jgi:D-threonate/D-erythronate kinase
MIVVVADDFTGAAELSGIAVRCGLKAELQTELDMHSNAQVLVMDTNTRSASAAAAVKTMTGLAATLKNVQTDWIYKKTDSVLRGHISGELTALMKGLGKEQALLIPANPSSGRIISNGHYFINGKYLHETDFCHDPEFPVTSSDVLELLGSSKRMPTYVQEWQTPLPAKGIIIGEAASYQGLKNWASCHNNTMIPAGGAEFFSALLEAKGFTGTGTSETLDFHHNKRTLIVCGSSSFQSHEALHKFRQCGFPVCQIPIAGLNKVHPAGPSMQQLQNKICEAIERHKLVVAAIDLPISRNHCLAKSLTRFTAQLVENVFREMTVDELFIEGGSTASAIVRRLKWTRFIPCQEMAPGVVRMRVSSRPQTALTVKPGSYSWPVEVWTLWLHLFSF